jgi:uncharacterized membrane protein YjfL (UPF0719 family)
VLAEIFTTAEMVKQICDISGGIEEYMIRMKDSIVNSASLVETKQMTEIAGSVQLINYSVKELLEMKKKAVFAEKTI